jgi:hypothetical protein
MRYPRNSLLMYWRMHYAAACPGALQMNKNHIIRLYIKLLNMFNITPSSLAPSP